MTEATFNFLVDTTYELVLMNEHKDELIELCRQQVADDVDVVTKQVFK